MIGNSGCEINKGVKDLSKMERVSLKVSGMSCAHCENRVASAVRKLPGVAEASASAKDAKVDVAYDAEKTGTKQIKEAILESGYIPD
jgi:copper chaperone